jgi:hypothetical protein
LLKGIGEKEGRDKDCIGISGRVECTREVRRRGGGGGGGGEGKKIGGLRKQRG